MTDLWVAFAVGLAVWGLLSLQRLQRFLHILQLEEYLTPQYLRWLSTHAWRYLPPRFLLPVVVGTAIAVFLVVLDSGASDSFPNLALVGVLSWVVAGGQQLAHRMRSAYRPRKPLVMTARARRLLITGCALVVFAVTLVVALGLLAGEREAIVAGLAVTTLACALAGHVILLANLVLWPLEERSRRRFQAMAARKLQAQRPRIIAITGSAGKTTTKDLVAHLLSARYRVLKTPASFNTPLGIARTVNDALDNHEVFVVEMGAYKRGEIAKLCRLVGGTDVSVITTVNAQHLERFGSLEATAQAKFEIVEGLRPGGTAILNFDVPALRRRASCLIDVDVLAFGSESEDARLRATNVAEGESGIELDVTFGTETVHVQTPLLARHNATNVLAAFGVGLSCGLDLGYMAAAMRRFQPPEHRLQPVQMDNGVTMLDDAYNANPEGIIGAIEVLGRYAPRRRVLVSSGLIEMGNEKPVYHRRIGEAAARHADLVILVGPKQTADIREAMLVSSFPAGQLHIARNPAHAQHLLRQLGEPGDVILYSTDLPDQYDEYLTI